MRVVLDTNVLLAAFLTEGLCWKLLLKANRGEYILFTSPYILNEFKSKLSGKFAFSVEEVRESMHLLAEISQDIDPEKQGIQVKGVCRDKKDDQILACGIASEADFLVTGDSDLLILKKYKGMKILNPRDFELLLVGLNEK